MKGLMSFLVKAKLVEPTLEASDKASDEPQEPEYVAPAVSEVEPPIEPIKADTNGEIEESLPLEVIFQQADLPPSPFPAEKLLRLLDGLRTMDAQTRKAAVLAMDAADDNWSITDPVQDAERKIAALTAYRERLGEQLAVGAKQAGDQIAADKHGLETTVAEIRAQITQLEQLLEREIVRSAQEIAAIEGGQRAAREAVGREQRRIDQEIERFGEIPASYAATP